MDLYPLKDTFHNKCGSQGEGTGAYKDFDPWSSSGSIPDRCHAPDEEVGRTPIL